MKKKLPIVAQKLALGKANRYLGKRRTSYLQNNVIGPGCIFCDGSTYLQLWFFPRHREVRKKYDRFDVDKKQTECLSILPSPLFYDSQTNSIFKLMLTSVFK